MFPVVGYATEAKQDTAKTVVDASAAKIGRAVCSMEFWSLPGKNDMQVTNVSEDRNFKNIVVAGLPAGITLLRVQFLLNVPVFSNIGAGANRIDQNEKIRVKKSTGTWDVDDLDGISFVNYDLYFGQVSVNPIPLFLNGDADIKAEVDENATYNVQWEDSKSAIDGFYLMSAQVGLKIWFLL
jgi:hypothetical protein